MIEFEEFGADVTDISKLADSIVLNYLKSKLEVEFELLGLSDLENVINCSGMG